VWTARDDAKGIGETVGSPLAEYPRRMRGTNGGTATTVDVTEL
jgi:hypothetical protein